MKTRRTVIIPQLYKEEFPFRVEELSAFSYKHGMFLISLKDRNIIRYETTNPEDFFNWLKENGVRDIDG
ncbi:MAG: hypothetical protein R2800_08360 [Flavipsychrobacter sp.]